MTKGYHNHGQGVLVLQGAHAQARPPPTCGDTSTLPPFRTHSRLPSRSATILAQPHLPVYRNRQNISVARVNSTTDCARALFTGWIPRFRVPSTITSDRGAQFTSPLWAAMCGLRNLNHSTTTAYHPQWNGLLERFHRRLKEALRSRAAAVD
jgi:transposase InsO family protein